MRPLRGLLTLLACLSSHFGFAPTAASAPSVVLRQRLGHDVEDVTVVRGGPLDHHVVALDGNALVAMPEPGQGNAPARELADLRELSPLTLMNGIAWIPTEKVFALVSGQAPTKILVVDGQGRRVEERDITHPGGFVPTHLEGMTWIPKGAPRHAERLALVVHESATPLVHIDILRPDGVVEAEIAPPDPLRTSFVVGLAYAAPGRLLLTTTGNVIWTLGLDGTLGAAPVRLPESEGIEALAELSDGRLVATDFSSGAMRVLSSDLDRLPDDDAALPGALLVPAGRSIAWDTETDRFLVLGAAGMSLDPNVPTTAVYSVGHDLRQTRAYAAPSAAGFPGVQRMSFIPGENRGVLAHRAGPRALLLADGTGRVVEQVTLGTAERPVAVEWIPTTRQFAVRTVEGGPQVLRFFSRSGAFVRAVDLSATGIDTIGGLAFYEPTDPSGGRLLVTGTAATGTLVAVDMNGVLLASADYRVALDMPQVYDVRAITSGPLAGTFAAVDANHDELVIFKDDD